MGGGGGQEEGWGQRGARGGRLRLCVTHVCSMTDIAIQ